MGGVMWRGRGGRRRESQPGLHCGGGDEQSARPTQGKDEQVNVCRRGSNETAGEKSGRHV